MGADLPEAAPARIAVLVLGMHRSGTSALAGVLAAMGCDGPRTPIASSIENPKGFFEARPVARLNDEILASAGTTWDDWQGIDPDWQESQGAASFLDRALEVLTIEFGDSSHFVLKDPRICRLVPFWAGALQAAGCEPLVVHTHRHPLEVAASLERRNGIEPGVGQLLWLRHVLSAEADSRAFRRGFTSYEALLNDWAGAMEGIERGIGQRLPRPASGAEGEVTAFLSPDLRRHRQPEGQDPGRPIPSPWIRDALAILDRWAARGEVDGDRDRLDEIRHDLDACAPTFAGAIAQARASAREGQKAQTNFGKVRAELAAAQSESAERLKAIKNLENALEPLEQQHRQAASQVDRLTQEAVALRRDLARAEQARDGLVQDMERKEAEAALTMDRLTREAAALRRDLVRAEEDRDELAKEVARREQAAAIMADHLTLEAAALRQDLLWSKQACEGLTQNVARSEKEAASLQAELAARARTHKVLESQVQSLAGQVVQLEAGLADKDATVEEQRQQMERLQRVLDAVLTSSTWRLTRPVRRLFDLLKDLRPR